jgi:PTH1 family peptidyl-tRNA hydrolase
MKPSLVVIGLGNPGKQYETTRHNAGFRAVEALAKEYGEGEWREVQKFTARTMEARVVTVPVLLVQPLTFMNRSGETVRKIVDFFKLDAAHQILIISDEIDLPAGDVRVRMNGGPGTHNGLRSIVTEIGEGFPRMRLGVGMPQNGQDLATWVLSATTPEEEAVFQETLRGLPERLKNFVLESPPQD